MKRLRINLHIREDVSPALYAALAAMAPKPRAERLRTIAEVGLRVESAAAALGSSAGGQGSGVAASVAPAAGTAAGFGSDVAGLLGDGG